LGAVKKRSSGIFDIYIGNIKVTSLRPQYFKIASECKVSYPFEIDGKKVFIQKASTFQVNDDFKVIKEKDYRVNIIGYHSKKADESEETISLKQLNKHYAVDTKNKVYRVEFYKNDEFCSMIMAKFK
jgi:hypothetical protein